MNDDLDERDDELGAARGIATGLCVASVIWLVLIAALTPWSALQALVLFR